MTHDSGRTGYLSSGSNVDDVEVSGVVTLGVILLVIGLIVGPPVITVIGIVLIVLGLILNLVPVGGSTRRIW